MSSRRDPISSGQVLISSRRVLISSQRVLISSRRFLVSSRRHFTSSRRVLISSRWFRISSRRVLHNSRRDLITGVVVTRKIEGHPIDEELIAQVEVNASQNRSDEHEDDEMANDDKHVPVGTLVETTDPVALCSIAGIDSGASVTADDWYPQADATAEG